MSFHSAFYRGELMHARHDELARRAFRYGVYMAVLDLDELPALHQELRLFSYRGRNVFSFDDRDYTATLSPSASVQTHDAHTHEPPSHDAHTCDLTVNLDALRASNGLATPHATRLVTNLRVAGYVFNPVSFFIDYDERGAITNVIAEVNNTYGGRFRYVLGPAARLPSARGDRAVGFRHTRELFVSPFLHGALTYDFWFDAPLDDPTLAIEMHVSRGAGASRLFTARFTGSRTVLSDRALASAALRYPFMTAQVIGLIHLEALKLRLRGVPYRRPGPDHRPLSSDPVLR